MKDGFYWARYYESEPLIVEISGDDVWRFGNDYSHELDNRFTILSGPLTYTPAPQFVPSDWMQK